MAVIKKKPTDYEALARNSPYTLGDDYGDDNQFIVLFFSATGHGKTTSSLDAPGPICYIDIDYRAKKPIREARAAGKVVFHYSVKSVQKTSNKTEEQVKLEARKSWDGVMKAVDWAMQQKALGNVRTLVLDTASELYQLVMFKTFGRTDKIMKRDHGIPRHEFRSMIKAVRQCGLNAVLLCHQKEEYRNDAPTGKMIWAGFEDMAADADMCFQLQVVNKKFSGETERRTRFEATSFKPGVNAMLYGVTITSDEWEAAELGIFRYLAWQSFPDVDPSVWED